MDTVTLAFKVRRIMTPDYPGSQDATLVEYHLLRSKLLHSLATTCSLEINDWGDTDDKHSHEVVEILVEALTGPLLKVILEIFKLWIQQKQIENVDVLIPGNGAIQLRLKNATPTQIRELVKELKLN